MTTIQNTLQRLALRETNYGLRLVRFLLDVMDTEIKGVKITDRRITRIWV